MRILTLALALAALLTIFAAFSAWRARRAGRSIIIWGVVVGGTLLVLAYRLWSQSVHLSGSAELPIADNKTRPLVRIRAETVGDLVQSTDGNYLLSVRLLESNAGTAPAYAFARILPTFGTPLSKLEQQRMMRDARRALARMGSSVFAGVPDVGTVEELAVPARAVKITPQKDRGFYTVVLPPLLLVETYRPLIKGTIYQTSYAIRPKGEAPLPVPPSNVLLKRAAIKLDRLPGFDDDE